MDHIATLAVEMGTDCRNGVWHYPDGNVVMPDRVSSAYAHDEVVVFVCLCAYLFFRARAMKATRATRVRFLSLFFYCFLFIFLIFRE